MAEPHRVVVAVGGDRRKRTRSGAVIVPPDDDQDEGKDADGASNGPAGFFSCGANSGPPPGPSLGWNGWVQPSPSSPSWHVVKLGSALRRTGAPLLPGTSFLCPLTTSIVGYDPLHVDHSSILRRPHQGRRRAVESPPGDEESTQHRLHPQKRRRETGWDEADAAITLLVPPCPYVARMRALLEALPCLSTANVANDMRGANGAISGSTSSVVLPRLCLNASGSAAFHCHPHGEGSGGIVVVLDVPSGVGLFHLYTRGLLHDPSDHVQRRMLELNFLQGETRGGCLSIRRRRGIGTGTDGTGSMHHGGATTSRDEGAEVVFSYNDRINEITCHDLRNILLNFVETSLSIRERLCTGTTTDGARHDAPPSKKDCDDS